MEKGFLNSGSKKSGVEEKIGSSMHEASNATKNDGIQLGKDGKPLHNPKGGPIKPILKTGKVTVAGESIIASKSGPMQQGSFFVEPSLSTSNEPSTQGSMADLFKSNQQRNKKIIKVSHITTFEEINGADVAIPKAAVDEVREHFSNTLYGYFIGKRIPFLIVEKYVLNTWAKYGIERAIIRNGFYLFKFKTKEGMEQVMEHGPWTIRLSPLILNIWKPNTKLVKEEVASIPVWVKLHKVPIVAYSEVGLSYITSKLGKPIMLDSYTCDMCLNPWGRSSYARALIEMTSDRAFVESLVVGIPLEDGLGHSMETIEVEYEWKPPHCGVCKTFGHTLSTCPKRTTETTNSGNKNTTKSDSKSINTADEEGFVEVSNRKNKGKNHGKSTRIDGIKFTKPKASFY
ncbi:zinc knuckle CX2CX4HX4C containing protein [Tanacetum coccineum]